MVKNIDLHSKYIEQDQKFFEQADGLGISHLSVQGSLLERRK